MKIVIISGGSSGIGRACINKFLDNGYYVYNFDIIPSDLISENCSYLKVDVTKQSSITNGVREVISKHKQIDVLITSAGKHLSANIEATTDNELFDIINLNLLGSYWLIKKVIPQMKIQNKGSIITIGSDQSTIVKANSTVYGMTKAALLSLTKSVALDYAKYNIRANCIGAGTIDTPLYQSAIARYSKKTGISLAQIEKKEALEQPLGRIGTPEEIANVAYFLAEDTASFITGGLIPVDGGYIIN